MAKRTTFIASECVMLIQTEWTWCITGRMPRIWKLRGEMLRDAGWVYAELEKDGILLPVVQLNLTYKKPARYDQLLEVHTVVAEAPTSKLRLQCEVRFEQDVLLQGEVILVFVDAKVADLVVPLLGLQNVLLNWG